ncbi:MAG: cupin domain-containing protein [Acidimicrobiia bacterium]
MSEAFDLSSLPVHLGLGARAEPLPGFAWTPEYLAEYGECTASDGDDGRLVIYERQDAPWTSWERHPAGEEVVILVSGRADLFQEIDGDVQQVTLTPGMAVINPRGVWHTADVHEPSTLLFITPGRGTENRPR